MILDGYSRRIKLDDHTFVYRPATRGERDQFRHAMKFLSHDIAQAEAITWVKQHMVYGPETYPTDLTEQLLAAISGIIPDESGQTWVEIELEWQANLRDGVRLAALNPKLATRSCEDCQNLWYSEKTGDPILTNSTMQPMLRVGLTPCRTDIGCLKGTPEKPKSLNKANRWAYQHFLKCRATGHFPDDEIVALNAAIIEAALARKVAA